MNSQLRYPPNDVVDADESSDDDDDQGDANAGVAYGHVNPKGTLQEYAQQRGLPIPVYEEISCERPHHQPTFTFSVAVPGPLIAGVGVGTTRRKHRSKRPAMPSVILSNWRESNIATI